MGNLAAAPIVDRRPSGVGRLDVRVAAMVVAACLLVAALGMALRAPWLDEFLVRYSVVGPSELLTRTRGSGHPLGWYLPLVPAARFGLAMPWLRAVSLVVLPVATALVCRPLVPDTTRWVRWLVLTTPAAVGTAVVLERGTDARPYGALTFAALICAATLWAWADRPQARDLPRWAAALTLLAVTHLTGAVLAGWFALAVVRLSLRRSRTS